MIITITTRKRRSHLHDQVERTDGTPALLITGQAIIEEVVKGEASTLSPSPKAVVVAVVADHVDGGDAVAGKRAQPVVQQRLPTDRQQRLGQSHQVMELGNWWRRRRKEQELSCFRWWWWWWR